MTQEETKRKRGRPAFQPTDEQRETVQAMTSYGIPEREIAAVIGVSQKTITKYFPEERATGTAKANAQVAQSLFKQAVEGNVGAACFWLKTRAGWREKQDIELTGKDGGPVKTETKIDPSGLSDNTLAELMTAKRTDDSSA